MSSQSPFQDIIMNLSPLTKTQDSNVPTNQELLDSMEKLKEAIHEQRINNEELDLKGQNIAAAIESFLDTSKSLVKEKNPDEGFQKFIDHALAFGQRVEKEAGSKSDKLEDKANASMDRLSHLAENLKRLVQQLFSSSDARALFRDIEAFLQKWHDIIVSSKDNNYNSHKITEEAKKDLVKSSLTLCSKIGSSPASKEMRQDLLSIYDYWRGAKDEISQDIQHDFNCLFDEALHLMNRFTNKDVDALKKKTIDTLTAIEEDKDTQQFFSSLRKWTDDIVNNPRCADRGDMVKEGERLIDKALEVLDKHSDKFSSLLEEYGSILRSLQEEKLLKRYKDDIEGVRESLKGSYLDTIVQLRTLMIPVISTTMKETKLPRIQEKDSSGSWSIDNIILCGKESSLDDVSLDFKIGLKDIVKVVLTIRHIDVLLKDINFEYGRTTLPAWTDKGTIDVRIYSPSWRLKWIVNQEKGREAFFELSEVNGRIKRLDVNIIQAEHSWLDSILIPMWTPALRRKAQESIEEMLKNMSLPLTDKLNQFFANAKGSSATSRATDDLIKKLTPSTLFGDAHPVIPKEPTTI